METNWLQHLVPQISKPSRVEIAAIVDTEEMIGFKKFIDRSESPIHIPIIEDTAEMRGSHSKRVRGRMSMALPRGLGL